MDAHKWLSSSLGAAEHKPKPIGGSDWATYTAHKHGGREFFVKSSSRPSAEMFEGEAYGLEALRLAAALCVPRVQHFGDGAEGSFLILEMLDMRGRREGRRHALHQCSPSGVMTQSTGRGSSIRALALRWQARPCGRTDFGA